MIIMSMSFTAALAILVSCLIPVSDAGSFCVDSYGDTEYCYYGCCLGDTCCPGISIGLIAGLSCGGVALLIGLLVLVLCVRRRRRLYGGFIYTNQAPNSTVVSPQLNHNMVSTTGASQQQFAAGQGYANPGYGPAPPYAPYPANGPKY